MASSVYQRFGTGAPSGVAAAVQAARGMAGGDPTALYQRLMATNPAFRRFVADNRGKSPRQIAQEHGVDLAQVQSMIGGTR